MGHFLDLFWRQNVVCDVWGMCEECVINFWFDFFRYLKKQTERWWQMKVKIKYFSRSFSSSSLCLSLSLSVTLCLSLSVTLFLIYLSIPQKPLFWIVIGLIFYKIGIGTKDWRKGRADKDEVSHWVKVTSFSWYFVCCSGTSSPLFSPILLFKLLAHHIW